MYTVEMSYPKGAACGVVRWQDKFSECVWDVCTNGVCELCSGIGEKENEMMWVSILINSIRTLLLCLLFHCTVYKFLENESSINIIGCFFMYEGKTDQGQHKEWNKYNKNT